VRVYISHAIAGRTEANIQAAEAWGSQFANNKWKSPTIVLPRRIYPWCITDIRYAVEDNSCLVPGRLETPQSPHTVQCYLRADIEQLLKCDAIVMTPGWQSSSGCLFELSVAAQCGIQIHFA
jgi:hypothetical protein